MPRDNELEQTLWALKSDRPRLALAGCLLMRRLAPSLDTVRPATRDAITVVERWARGRVPLDAVQRAREAAVEPSPLVVALYVLALEIVDEDLQPAVGLLASLVPWTMWVATPEGRQFAAAHPKRPLPELMREHAVARALEGSRAQLVAAVKHVFGPGNDDDEVHARYDAWIAGRAAGDRPQAIVAHDRLPEHAAVHSDGDRVLIEAVTAHLARHVEPPARVYHDHDSRWVHLDVHVVVRRDETVLATSGMAERPLYPLGGAGHAPAMYTELVMRLPAGWHCEDTDLADPRWFWPIAWLRYLGRMPHRHAVAYRPRETTGPMSPPQGPRAVELDAVLFLASTLVPPMPIVGRTVEFLAVCPLYPAELAFAREHGTDQLLAKFRARGLDPERVDPARPALVQ